MRVRRNSAMVTAWCLWLITGVVRPAFSQQARLSPIDLSRAYDASDTASADKFIPHGQQVFGGVPWNIAGSMPVTGIDSARAGTFHRSEVLGIAIGGKVDRFHFLHTVLQPEKEGRPLAKVVLHYADGSNETIRLVFGMHARDAIAALDARTAQLTDRNSRVVWQVSEPEPLVLFASAFDNPRPNQEVSTVDFVSLFSRSVPVLAAITTEQNPPAELLLSTGGGARASKRREDTTYRRNLQLRVVDDTSKRPLLNARAALTIKDDAKSFSFGSFTANAAGVITIPYPPQEAVDLHLSAQAPGFVSGTTNISLLDAADPLPEIMMTLEKGEVIGGLVVNSASQPIERATVNIFQTVNVDGRDLRTNMGLVYTGLDGRWEYPAQQGALTSLSLEVAHAAYRSLLFERPNARDLAATNLVALLKGYPQITGKVIGPDGDPVKGAKMTLVGETVYPPSIELATAESGSDGQFAIDVKDDATNSTLGVIASAPKLPLAYARVARSSIAEPVSIRLRTGDPLTVRVLDAKGLPVPGTKVTLETWQRTFAINWQSATDADGYYTWDNAPDGNVWLRYETTNFPPQKHVLTLPATNTPVTYTLTRPVLVYGKVIDAITKQPVGPCKAMLSSQYEYPFYQGFRGWSFRGSAQGWDSFELKVGGKGQSEWRVTIEVPGYDVLNATITPPAEPTTNVFAMTKGSAFAGSVVREDGEPVVGASVSLLDKAGMVFFSYDAGMTANPAYEVVQSEQDGRFTFASKVQPDAVIASHPKFGYGVTKVDVTNRSCKVVLHKWGAVRGVLKVGDTVRSNWLVSVHTRYQARSKEDRPREYSYVYYSVRPTKDGEFFFGAVPPGPRGVYLRVIGKTGEGGSFATSHGVPVTVKPGETNIVIIGNGGRTIKGKLALTGYDPKLIDWNRDVHSLNSESGSDGLPVTYILNVGEDGSFEVSDVPPGDYKLNSMLTEGQELRRLAKLVQPVTIPDGVGPYDAGTFTLQIQ